MQTGGARRVLSSLGGPWRSPRIVRVELIKGVEKGAAALVWDNLNRQPRNPALFAPTHVCATARVMNDQSPNRALSSART